MELHADLVSAPAGTPSRRVVFLHGILGSGANLRQHARRFVEARPDWQAMLLDLRAHGRSLAADGSPDTLASAAADVQQTVRAPGPPLAAVVGHSFGGKVALALTHLEPGLAHVVTLDSAPGTRVDARGSEGTLAVLALLRGLRGPWETRDAFTHEVQSAGQSRPLAQWLAMNLDRVGQGLVFRLDLARIDALLQDYLATDLWPAVETARARVHLAIGGRSSVYVAADQARARALAETTHGRVTVDVLDTGHWMHVDDPDGVHRLLLARLSP